ISYKLKDPAGAGFTLYDLTDQLRMRGWQVPAMSPASAGPSRAATLQKIDIEAPGIAPARSHRCGGDSRQETSRSRRCR
ncbi:hypothetical protein AB0K48_59415, partial [Nonomuraea sp. NPDC055795]